MYSVHIVYRVRVHCTEYLFILGAYDALSAPELSQMISENAFVCIYLVFQFSQLGKTRDEWSPTCCPFIG